MAATTKTRIETPWARLHLIQWQLDNTDADPPYEIVPNYNDMTVQLVTVDSGTPTLGWEGSLNLPGDASKVWVRLTDPQGNQISMTAAAIEAVQEAPLLIRPRVVSGTGQATVRLKANQQYPGD